MRRFFTKKKKCKDGQNGPIHPENSRLKFLIIGGVRSNFWADSPILLNFILFYLYGHIF